MIHHLHLYNPLDSSLKLNHFTKIINAMKILNRFFSHKKKVERDKINARRDKMNARISEELY